MVDWILDNLTALLGVLAGVVVLALLIRAYVSRDRRPPPPPPAVDGQLGDGHTIAIPGPGDEGDPR